MAGFREGIGWGSVLIGLWVGGCERDAASSTAMAEESSGQQGQPEASGPPVLPVPSGEPALLAGKQIFEANCVKCHVEGLGDAPVIFEQQLWKDRVAKPKATLYKHAIEGFWGEVGEMPARGDNEKLTDAQVRSAVDYIVFVQQRS